MDSKRERTPYKGLPAYAHHDTSPLNANQPSSSPTSDLSASNLASNHEPTSSHDTNSIMRPPPPSAPILNLNTDSHASRRSMPPPGLKIPPSHGRRRPSSPYHHTNSRYEPYSPRHLDRRSSSTPTSRYPPSYVASPIGPRVHIPPDERYSSKRRMLDYQQRRPSMHLPLQQQQRKQRRPFRPFRNKTPPPLPEDPSVINIWKMSPNDNRKRPLTKRIQTDTPSEEPLRPLKDVIAAYLSRWGSDAYKASVAAPASTNSTSRCSRSISPTSTMSPTVPDSLSTATQVQPQQRDNNIGTEVQEWPDEAVSAENDRLFGQGWWAHRVSRWNVNAIHNFSDDEDDYEYDEFASDEGGDGDDAHTEGESSSGVTEDEDFHQLYDLYHNTVHDKKSKKLPQSLEEIDMELDEAFGEAFGDIVHDNSHRSIIRSTTESTAQRY
ncbi:hypothetical protein SeMB42_g07735 [Synchytrium endobioticum]|uniref:Uncharacterized protein n=1 Tax=Synchytrium endobioticum TaxID=286115 RepID=A0A507BXP2_9FUNG|nr:hypothetical protein SeMB42_g07735 [Synchytrium endobioticum]TPX37301.1 hypothetical protein SeLEV6574_g07930 [Synchytrium endobioticum]